MLRQTKLKVIDEVANGLSYLRLHVLSRTAAPLWRDRRQARRHFRQAARQADRLVPARSAPGSAATATAIRSSPRTSSTRRCGCRAPGRSAITSTNCTSSAANFRSHPTSPRSSRGTGGARGHAPTIPPPPGARSPTGAPSPACIRASPRRRASSTMSSRCASRSSTAPPYASRRRVQRRSRDHRALAQGRPAPPSSRAGACARLQRAVDVFGFHLAPIDLQAELRRARAHGRRTLRRGLAGPRLPALSEEERVELLRRELISPRPLVSPFIAYSEETAGELALFRAAADDPAQIWPRRDPHLASSPRRDSVSDMLELALMLKEVGLVTARRVVGARRSCRCSRRSTTCAPASA